MKNSLISPKGYLFRLLRLIFSKLPSILKNKLNGPADNFVSWAHSQHLKKGGPVKISGVGDISWNDFNANILSNRLQYKGVFIQELVIDWNVPLYQRPQHIASALGGLGYLVIYRTGNWAGDDVNGFREVEKNVWLTNAEEVDGISGAVRSIYSTAYAYTPELVEKNGRRGVVIYEYIDHIDPEISGNEDNINRLVNLKNYAFSGGADFIVASAKKLYEEAVQTVGVKNAILIPNGVDAKHYRNFLHNDIVPSREFINFRKKFRIIVGYFGALAPWLWYDCIKELVAVRTDIGFVFIGPDYYGGADNLPVGPNILRIGAVDYKILPAYANKFDICFIPFKPGEIAKTTSPLKLFEYFALEKPVVVTSGMSECVVYEEVFKGGSAEELSKAIDEAIQTKDNIFYKKKLRNLADQNDWLQRAKYFELFFNNL